jgi:anti-anti-sigma factor
LCLPIEPLPLDMGGVTFMDSSGLAVLIQLRGEANDRDKLFALAAVPRCVQRVLETTDTDRLFDIR